jgi:ABC-type multidrug transport system fused ATPase/permease subunit
VKNYIFGKHKARFFILLVFELLQILGSVGVALLLSLQIDAITQAVSTGELTLLLQCAKISVLYGIVLGLLIFATNKGKAVYFERVMCALRQDVFSGILHKDFADYHKKNSADYITLLNQNMDTVEENYLKNLFSIIEACIGILTALVLLLFIHPVIAVISIGAMTVPSLVPMVYGKGLAGRQTKIVEEAGKYMAKIKDSFLGYEVLKAYKKESNMEKLHKDYAKSYEKSKAELGKTMAQVYGVTNMASIIIQFFVLFLSGLFAVKGLITIGNIIAITQLTGQVIAPAFELSAQMTRFRSVKPVCETLLEVADLSSGAEKDSFCEMKECLKVKDLSYSYGEKEVLRGVNHSFEKGKRYAIIGKSGSGKSTLLKLLAGYYGDYTGEILVDGKSDRICDSVFIQQNVFLFDDTIRNNLTMYDSYTEEELQNAIHKAGLDEVILALPEGLDTYVEENGSKFSGGERQRMAVARGILHQKSVFLVDEATSALDKENARLVEESILALEGVTSITVTHHLSPESERRYDEVIRVG